MEGDDEYNDGNRAFLQAFMARGTMTLREAKPILANILTIQEGEPVETVQITQEIFDSYLSAAQEALSSLDYDIRSTMHQVAKKRIWAIVNTTSDAMTQLATLHSAEEIAFVKRVLDAMFDKYNSPRLEAMFLDSMQFHQCCRAPAAAQAADAVEEDGEEGQPPQPSQQLRGLKSSEAEAMMQSMVDEGWFERSVEGCYSLSPRALMELHSWLIETYNDPGAEPGDWQRIKFCEACKDIVTVGQRCTERDCNVRLHDICEEAFWRTKREKKCPKCQTLWDGKHFVGERAVTETEAYRRSKGHRGRDGRSSGLMEQIMAPDEEEEEEEDQEHLDDE
ncbi:Non-structural maintenance of chromosomes element 1-like protein [Apiospora phragmitis]|uniref:Non-structural maintenance of chromosomes element 1 homolog n=1 Tax=Apiospora phragmitis TaxID=2905665 RepID=A0ABR1X626_9PEZI